MYLFKSLFVIFLIHITEIYSTKHGGNCILPPQPQNGKYSFVLNSNNPDPGTTVPHSTLISFQCQNNTSLIPSYSKFIACIDGKWSVEFPSCLSTCPPRVSSLVETDCELNGIKVNCSTPMIEGTRVSMKCKPFYETVEPVSGRLVSSCKDGLWSNDYIKCEPVCGKVPPKGIPLIISGELQKMGDIPWHVGVYKKNHEIEHRCGGTLISPSVVLSAAHCFTKSSNGDKYSVDDLYIAAGKYYRDYNDVRDIRAQKIKVKEIKIPSSYKGMSSNFFGDIAVVVLEKPVTITRDVLPVCVDWKNEYEDQQLITNNTGKVAGWGYTKPGGKQSTDLKEIKVRYIDNIKCIDYAPQDFNIYLTMDKLCSSPLNDQSIICNGDAGGGLVFYRPEVQRYYIRGVTSLSPVKDGVCNPVITTYTKISSYLDFIKS